MEKLHVPESIIAEEENKTFYDGNPIIEFLIGDRKCMLFLNFKEFYIKFNSIGNGTRENHYFRPTSFYDYKADPQSFLQDVSTTASPQLRAVLESIVFKPQSKKYILVELGRIIHLELKKFSRHDDAVSWLASNFFPINASFINEQASLMKIMPDMFNKFGVVMENMEFYEPYSKLPYSYERTYKAFKLMATLSEDEEIKRLAGIGMTQLMQFVPDDLFQELRHSREYIAYHNAPIPKTKNSQK